MPPKKNGAAAKAKAAASSNTPRTTRTEVTDTVTTNRGKEYATTAALSRPRRETSFLPTATPSKRRGRPATKASADMEPPARKRGRPATKASADMEPPAKKRGSPATKTSTNTEPPAKKRGPGRPPKKVAEQEEGEEEEDYEDEDKEAADEPVPTPKPRGRPPKKTKAAVTKAAALKPAAKAAPKATKKRGRPSKADIAAANGDAEEDADEEAEEEDAPPLKKRGRPSRKIQGAVPKEESGPPKKRGSSPRGGETTKMDVDDDAAAEQLEDELIDTADKAASKPAARAKGKAAKSKAHTHDEEDADGDDELEESTGKRYWLMKAEQEDREEILEDGTTFNTKFTVDDLKSKGGPEPWDGVRNPTAAKNMRAMKQGDLAFFYASGGKGGRKPGIVGIMEIVKEHESDQTAWDKGAYGYVKDEKARDRWCVVHVEHRNKLIRPVLLSDLQSFGGDGGVLSKMQVLKQSRLSVTTVSEGEWNFINEQLIEGFEEEDALPGVEGSGSLINGTTNVEEESTLITTEQTNGEVVINEAIKNELDLPLGTVPAGPVLPTTESEVPSTDTIFPIDTSQTSRPASRAGSRDPSVNAKATASRQSSRASSVAAGSLAVPDSNARRRSRVRDGSAAPTNGLNGDGAAGMQTIGEGDE